MASQKSHITRELYEDIKLNNIIIIFLRHQDFFKGHGDELSQKFHFISPYLYCFNAAKLS